MRLVAIEARDRGMGLEGGVALRFRAPGAFDEKRIGALAAQSAIMRRAWRL